MAIQAADLRRAIEGILQAAGSHAAEAEEVAARLVEGNLKGHDSHGVGRCCPTSMPRAWPAQAPSRCSTAVAATAR
jgi:LDH2 family malate/lactate/ureidoglycolate dehydrogenase